LRWLSHALYFRLAQALYFGDAAMTQTIIGVFDTFQDAERAQARLETEGIARTDMRVHSNDERSTLSTDPRRSGQPPCWRGP
jgi:hypothetical protein